MINISPSALSGTINAIPSKSFAHRVLILASLAKGKTTLVGKSTGVDTNATVGVLKALGADIVFTKEGYDVTPIKTTTPGAILNVHESGSTLRFLLPLVAVLGVQCTIIGEGRLAQRPNKELIDALRLGGAKFDNDTLPLNVSGKFDATDVYIQADISSQFVSGLLMAMQLLNHTSNIHLVGELKSKKYVDITIACMQDFGAKVTKTADGFALPGGGYTTPNNYTIEGDWSNSAFWLVGGAIGGDITVNNLNLNSLQGDKAIIQILQKAGADIHIENNSVTVKKSNLKAFSFDMEDVPDLVPIVGVLATQSTGKTTLCSVERLRLKESDRIQSTLDLLHSFGINATYSDKIIIESGVLQGGGVVQGYNDHRIVMSGAIAASMATNKTSITMEHAVNKSYTDFFIDFEYLGGIVNA